MYSHTYGSGRAFRGSLLLLLFPGGQIRQIASMAHVTFDRARISSLLRPALSTQSTSPPRNAEHIRGAAREGTWSRASRPTAQPVGPGARTSRSARCGAHERDACPASLVPVPLGETLGLPVREKPRVRPAVVAHGQRAVAQINDLHLVRMAALHARRVIMVAPVRRRGSARGNRGHLRSTQYLIHGPTTSPSVSSADLGVSQRKGHLDTRNLPIGGITEHLTRD